MYIKWIRGQCQYIFLLGLVYSEKRGRFLASHTRVKVKVKVPACVHVLFLHICLSSCFVCFISLSLSLSLSLCIGSIRMLEQEIINLGYRKLF
jgi:hypothetical protein